MNTNISNAHVDRQCFWSFLKSPQKRLFANTANFELVNKFLAGVGSNAWLECL